MLIDISNQFENSLDTLIKEDSKMVKTNCSLLSPDSIRRTVAIIVGLVMIGIGWYKKTRYDNKVFKYMEEFEENS